MRANIFILLALSLLAGGLTLWADRQSSVPDVEILGPQTIQAEPLPLTMFTDLDGKTHDVSGHRTILNFWASWCTPCVVEMPQLLAIAKASPNLRLVLVSVDSDAAIIRKFFAAHDLSRSANVIVVHDRDKAISKDLFGTIRYPETILIDARGVMVKKIAGATDWTAPAVKADIDGLN